ncbi:hypothetical protein [Mesorhizobium sp. M1273]|uniref:hypothetical protein n=1 Tax=Mesorhizobium sp. M1273 TaxID=2957075 RepID=UPI00333E028B
MVHRNDPVIAREIFEQPACLVDEVSDHRHGMHGGFGFARAAVSACSSCHLMVMGVTALMQISSA